MQTPNYTSRFSAIFLMGSIGALIWSLIIEVILKKSEQGYSVDTIIEGLKTGGLYFMYNLPAIGLIAMFIALVDMINIKQMLTTEASPNQVETFQFIVGRLWFYTLYVAVGFISYTLIIGSFKISAISIIGMIFLIPFSDAFYKKLPRELSFSNKKSILLYLLYIGIVSLIVTIWWLGIVPVLNH